jgi:triose/dihydroxyacetone kinase / FAD-AMP lyase (cyclizing)
VLRLDDERLAWLDAPTTALAWPKSQRSVNPTANLQDVPRIPSSPAVPVAAAISPTRPAAPAAAHQAGAALRAVLRALNEAAPELTRLDQIVGDGDLGVSLARGAAAVTERWASLPLGDTAATLRALAATVRQAVGGTSGPLYAIGLMRAAQAFDAPGLAPAARLAKALQLAAVGISDVGGAVAGQRTMLDALVPAATAAEQVAAVGSSVAPVKTKSGPSGALTETRQAAIERPPAWSAEWATAFAAALAAAESGAVATAAMLPRRGRSSYLGERALGHVDPGAQAVVVWLRALALHRP